MQLKEQYGKDPLDPASLTPPLKLPSPEEGERLVAIITTAFQRLSEDQAAAEEGTAAPISLFQFPTAKAGAAVGKAKTGSDSVEPTAPALELVPEEAGKGRKGLNSVEGAAEDGSVSPEEREELGRLAMAQWDAELKGEKVDGEDGIKEAHLADEFKYWYEF